MNETVNGESPDVGLPEKSANGGVATGWDKGTVFTLMYSVRVWVSLPSAFVAFSETV